MRSDQHEHGSAVHPRPPAALASIAGIGHYLPAQIVTNSDLALTVDTSDEWIVERTGIHGRRRAAVDQATSDLAVFAARAALEDAGMRASEIDLILLATSTPDQPVPSTACHLQARLECAGVPAMDVAAGCSGFGYALQMATGAVKSRMHERVLVVGADCLTRVTNYADRQSCILFGDGAGAVVVTAAGQGGEAGRGRGSMDVLYSRIGADGSAAGMIQIRAGGSREPACASSVAGARHTLELHGRDVFKHAVRQMGDCIQEAAAAVGVGVGDFDLVIPHQANARIIELVGKQLEVPDDRLVVDIGETGNMASASIPVALARAREQGRVKAGQLIVVVGFGAGTTWACQVLRVREAA